MKFKKKVYITIFAVYIITSFHKTKKYCFFVDENLIFLKLNLWSLGFIMESKMVSLKHQFLLLDNTQDKIDALTIADEEEFDILDYHWALSIFSPSSLNYFKKWTVAFSYINYPFNIPLKGYSILSIRIKYINEFTIEIKSAPEDYILLFLCLRNLLDGWEGGVFEIDGKIISIEDEIKFFKHMVGMKKILHYSTEKIPPFIINPLFDSKSMLIYEE